MNKGQEKELRELMPPEAGEDEIGPIKGYITHLLNSEREEIAKEIEGRMFPLVNIDKMPGNDSGLQKIHANAHLESAATIARSRITK